MALAESDRLDSDLKEIESSVWEHEQIALARELMPSLKIHFQTRHYLILVPIGFIFEMYIDKPPAILILHLNKKGSSRINQVITILLHACAHRLFLICHLVLTDDLNFAATAGGCKS